MVLLTSVEQIEDCGSRTSVSYSQTGRDVYKRQLFTMQNTFAERQKKLMATIVTALCRGTALAV